MKVEEYVLKMEKMLHNNFTLSTVDQGKLATLLKCADAVAEAVVNTYSPIEILWGTSRDLRHTIEAYEQVKKEAGLE